MSVVATETYRTNTDKAALQGRCPLFAGRKAAALDRLAARCTLRRLPAETTIFVAEDEPDGLRIVASGIVRIWNADAAGRAFALARPEAGDAFEEMALLDGRPRSAHATAQTEVTLLFLARAALEAALERDPMLARYLVADLCQKLRDANRTLHGRAYDDLRRRLARRLVDLARAQAEIAGRRAVVAHRISQTDLAEMIGATREAVNRPLRALVRDGLVETEAGRIALPDHDELAALVEDAY